MRRRETQLDSLEQLAEAEKELVDMDRRLAALFADLRARRNAVLKEVREIVDKVPPDLILRRRSRGKRSAIEVRVSPAAKRKRRAK